MFKIATLIFAIVGTTLAGIFITAILTVPGLIESNPALIIAGAIGGYLLAVPASLVIGHMIGKQGGVSA
jgi:hypothetical protein